MGGNADDGGGLEGGEDILELTTENSPILDCQMLEKCWKSGYKVLDNQHTKSFKILTQIVLQITFISSGEEPNLVLFLENLENEISPNLGFYFSAVKSMCLFEIYLVIRLNFRP